MMGTSLSHAPTNGFRIQKPRLRQKEVDSLVWLIDQINVRFKLSFFSPWASIDEVIFL